MRLLRVSRLISRVSQSIAARVLSSGQFPGSFIRFFYVLISLVKNVVRMPKQRVKQVRTRISYMTSDQLDRFLRAAKEHGPREHAMFLFAVAHGARAQEICNLRPSDVNFQNEQIHIARLKGSLPSTQTLLKVKGDSLFAEKAALKSRLAVRSPDADNYVFNVHKNP